MNPIEVPVMEGLLSFDGRVLELFRGDGMQGSWRLHARLITAVEQERRKDRILFRFYTAPKFYESASVSLEREQAAVDLAARVEGAGGR